MEEGCCIKKTRFSLLSVSLSFELCLKFFFLSYNIERYTSDVASDRGVRPTCKCAPFSHRVTRSITLVSA